MGTGFTPALTGNISDADFNPTVDRLRVVTDADQNARANPVTGALADSNTTTDGVQIDTALAYATTDAGTGVDPDIVAAGYTNSFAGATATTLYAIDAGRDVLVSIGSVEGATTAVSPNTGQLFSIGALTVDVASGGFDIANAGPAYALINAVNGTGTQLYSVNTATGAATLIGTVGDGTQTFGDIAIGASVLTVSPVTQTVARRRRQRDRHSHAGRYFHRCGDCDLQSGCPSYGCHCRHRGHRLWHRWSDVFHGYR